MFSLNTIINRFTKQVTKQDDSLIYAGEWVAFDNAPLGWYMGKVIEVDVVGQWALIQYTTLPGRFTGEVHTHTTWLTGHSVVKLDVFQAAGMTAANVQVV